MGPRSPRHRHCSRPQAFALQPLESRTLLSTTPVGSDRPLPSGPTPPSASVFLSASAASASYGAPVTLVARVLATGVAATDGTLIDFIDQQPTGNVLLAAVPAQNNTAAFVWSSAGVGTHQVIAEIAPNQPVPAAASPAAMLAVACAPTQTVLTTSADAVIAVVAADASITTGTVSFFAGTRELATVPVSPDGTATLPAKNRRAATQNLVAAYNGSADFSPSTSAAFNKQTGHPQPTITHDWLWHQFGHH